MQVTKQEAKDMIYNDHEDWSLLEKEIVGTTRWSTQYIGYFRHNPTNTTYMLDWQQGSTESKTKDLLITQNQN